MLDTYPWPAWSGLESLMGRDTPHTVTPCPKNLLTGRDLSIMMGVSLMFGVPSGARTRSPFINILGVPQQSSR